MTPQTSRRHLAAFLIPLLALAVVPLVSPFIHPVSAEVEAPGFVILALDWGTPSVHATPGPGSQDVPLTITLEYTYPQEATTINANLTLPSGFTDNDGRYVAEAYLSGDTSAGSTIQLTFYLDIGSNVSLGTYRIPLSFVWLTGSDPSTVTTNVQYTSISLPLKGAVSLEFNSLPNTLVAGELNNISLSFENSGSGEARQVSVAVSTSSQATVITQPSTVAALNAHSNVSKVVGIFVPESAAGSAVTLTFAATYIDPYNDTDTSTGSLGLLVPSTSQPKSDVVLEFHSNGKSLTPDSINEVNITVTNVGTTTARQLATQVAASGGATVLAQPSVISSLGAGTAATETVSLFVASAAEGSAITLSLGSSYVDVNSDTDTSSQTLGLAVAGTPLPILEVSSTAASTALVPGQATVIPVTITNVGTGEATNVAISASASAQAGSVEAVSPQPITTLKPGSSTVVNVTLFVAASAVNSPMTLNLSFTYADPYGGSQSASLALGLQVGSAAPEVAGVSLSVTSLKNSVVAGTTSTVSLVVENVGKSAIYSPVYSLSVSQPLIIAANSTSSAIGTVINPGDSQTVYVSLTASPSATSGIYPASLSITFTNQYGLSDSQTYSVSVLLSGSIELVIQSEQFSQTASDVTVTGDILNEGQSPAYYTSVSGYLNGSGTGQPDYVGEIDVNSPIPFSVTIPYQAQTDGGTVNVTLTMQYKNGLGQPSNSSSSEATQLDSLGQIVSQSSTTTNPTSSSGPNLLEIVLIGTIALVVIGTAVFAIVRRRASRKETEAAAGEGNARVT